LLRSTGSNAFAELPGVPFAVDIGKAGPAAVVQASGMLPALIRRMRIHFGIVSETVMLLEYATLNVSSRLKPLVVDLDGTLVRSDLLVESTFAYLGHNPLRAVNLLSALRRGKAALKAEIATQTRIDVSHLPYNEHVISLIRKRRAAGSQVYLASASNERYVRAVADHLGLFHGWFASDESENLSSELKARRLVETFGEAGFDYVGNETADLAVWTVASGCIAVGASPAVRSTLMDMNPDSIVFENTTGRDRAWIKLLRLHQWAKNALVFVPLVTAQRFDLLAFGEGIGAFLSFSLAASAIYILNDLVDLDADRKHPSKKRRPLAAGAVSVTSAIALIPALLIGGFIGALTINSFLAAVLLAYVSLTTAYTFVLKRKMLVDVVALASLYTIRVIGGSVAISVPISEWLLAFSMFIFMALALIKRYVELTTRIDAALSDPNNRNYRKSDLDIVAALAAAAGFNAVTVFALYISSDAVRPLYRYPQMLWLICPVLMYWLGRALLMAHRRLIDDDPIVFALRDWNSYAALALIGLILIAAR
jgi:4-hydroxybenzoate polyprenyltransferase/phosphoserine phosphatase